MRILLLVFFLANSKSDIKKTGLTIIGLPFIISSHTNSSNTNSSEANYFCPEVYERREIWKKRKKWVLMSAAGRNGI